MKNLIFLFPLFLSTGVLAQTKDFTFSGKVQGLDGETIKMYNRDANAPQGYTIDSFKVGDDGSFSHKLKIDEMKWMEVSPGVERAIKRSKDGRGFYPAKSSMFQFIAVPGGKVYFTGKITDFVDAYPSGDNGNNELGELLRKINPLSNQSVNIMVELGDKLRSGDPDAAEPKAEMNRLNKEVNDIKKKFLEDHPSSYAAAWLLSDMMIRSQVTNDEAIAFFKKMDREKLVSTPFYKEVAQRVDGILATALGNEVPDISSMNTYDGKKFDLKSLRGKYVVLDFWGTWCGPCISGMPKMKEYHDKYRNKLVLVGIAQESDDGTGWRNFLNKNTDYHWHQVLSRPDEDYILKFNVAGFPTKIIVDPQGKIVQRFVGEDDAIYNKLDEMLK